MKKGKHRYMLQITKFNKHNLPSLIEADFIAQFLYDHLEEYGDELEDIKAAMDFALEKNELPGGFILTIADNNSILAVAVVLNTLMSGFIPEHILVYIATHPDSRGKGIGKQLLNRIKQECVGDIALHVDSENPARKLYERVGFETPYLEMRLKQNK